jgi:hypothetical protein
MSYDMNAIMRQAQKMQEKMQRVQKELADQRVEHQTGGGMVKCVVSGQGEVLSITINPDAMSEGHELLEDMVLMAVREALAKAQELQKQRMSEITGGMNIPGLSL